MESGFRNIFSFKGLAPENFINILINTLRFSQENRDHVLDRVKKLYGFVKPNLFYNCTVDYSVLNLHGLTFGLCGSAYMNI